MCECTYACECVRTYVHACVCMNICMYVGVRAGGRACVLVCI